MMSPRCPKGGLAEAGLGVMRAAPSLSKGGSGRDTVGGGGGRGEGRDEWAWPGCSGGVSPGETGPREVRAAGGWRRGEPETLSGKPR